MTETDYRAILTAQATTARALKVARARSVLQHSKLKAHEMWAMVELETRELAETADRADIEAKILWAVHGQAIVWGMNGDREQVQ